MQWSHDEIIYMVQSCVKATRIVKLTDENWVSMLRYRHGMSGVGKDAHGSTHGVSTTQVGNNVQS